jgi:serine/threonine-protein kinase
MRAAGTRFARDFLPRIFASSGSFAFYAEIGKFRARESLSMPRPVSINAAMDLVRRSGLLSDAALEDWADESHFSQDSPDGYFLKMVEGGMLTPFQARQLAAGRWRGLVVQGYALADCIGSGGTGRVYLAKHLARDHSVAIKVLSPEWAGDPTARERLAREARAASSLNHPNIVRVTDLDVDHDPPYLVMEYVSGESLQALVARTGTFGIHAAALCGRQVALGLQHAWENGLVHRDIKPANLLLDSQGAVKILDLGIVSSKHESGLTLSNSRRRIILGTVDYLAPEQADDSSNVDCRADIYALGSTLYFLLAGRPPFEDASPTARLARKQMTDAVRLDCIRPDVPEGLAGVIARMMARNPHDRYPTPMHAAEALAPWAVPSPDFPEELFRRAQAHREASAGKFDPKASVKLGGSSVHRSVVRRTGTQGDTTREFAAAPASGAPTVRVQVPQEAAASGDSRRSSRGFQAFASFSGARHGTTNRRNRISVGLMVFALSSAAAVGYLLRLWLK